MQHYKLKLTHEQLKYFYQSLNIMFQHEFVSNNIDNVTHYNIKSFLKRLHDKLYHLSTVRVVRAFKYQINIDFNQHKALVEVYLFGKSKIENDAYLNILYMEIFHSLDKQEIEERDKHKIPPINIDIYKYQIDFNKIP